MKRVIYSGVYLVIACAIAAAGAPAAGAPLDDTAARLEAIEQENALLRKENAALRERSQLQSENLKLREKVGTREASRERPHEAPRPPSRHWSYEPAAPTTAAAAREPGTPPPAIAAVLADPRVASAYGADAALPVKAPFVPVKGEFSFFVEGGAFWTGGDPARTTRFDTAASFQNSGPPGEPFDLTPRAGWEAAVGFDYRFAGSPWHVSAQFRYGGARDKTDGEASSFGPAFHILGPGLAFNVTTAAQTTATNRESHWLADFAVGRDLSVGPDAMQVKVGFRVVELTSRIRQINNSQLKAIEFPAIIGGVVTEQTNTDRQQDASFRGAGPRIGVAGAIPLPAGWQLDYLAGAAVLFGTRRFDSIFSLTDTTTSNIPGFFDGPPSGFLATATDKKGATVGNVDLQAGLAYWVTPRFKVSASYRLDAYFGVLTTLDVAGTQRAIDRYFHGQLVAGTVRF